MASQHTRRSITPGLVLCCRTGGLDERERLLTRGADHDLDGLDPSLPLRDVVQDIIFFSPIISPFQIVVTQIRDHIIQL